LESGEGNGWLGEEEADFLYRKLIRGGSLVPVGYTNRD
jgi:hypothetical protein